MSGTSQLRPQIYVFKLTCCHRSFKSKCEHRLFILRMSLIADEYNRDSHAAPTNQPQAQAVPAAAPSTHSNPSNTPSTSRPNRSSRATDKQPAQPISKPLRRWATTSTAKTITRRDGSSSSPTRRQASLEAAATSAWRAQKQATVKPASQVHRMIRSEIPDDATGVQVCSFVLLFSLLDAEILEGCSYPPYTTALGTHRLKGRPTPPRR